MKLIVALGNPGSKYSMNHHNAGFIVIDEFCKRHNLQLQKNKFNGIYGKFIIDNQEIFIAKPQTFMNLSGEFVFSFINYFNIDLSDVLVIHDDKDILINKFKYKFDGGHGGQNGIRNIIDLNGSKFNRLRIGIGIEKISRISDYVLKDFSNENFIKLINNDLLYESIIFFIRNSFDMTAQKFNNN